MYVVAGDIFNPFMTESVAASLQSSGTDVDSANRDDNNAASMPNDVILALILERLGRGQPVEVVGFHGSNSDEEISGQAKPIREVITKKADPIDLSGASMVAEAWLGVAAPMGNLAGSCQAEDVNVRGYRCIIGNSRFPNLALLRVVR
jgi:hypothetical protein